MVNVLKTYTDGSGKVYTIDLKLHQFRVVEFVDDKPTIVFIDFKSEEGRALMKEYCEAKVEEHNDLASDYQRLVFDMEDEDPDMDTCDNIAEEMGKSEDKNNDMDIELEADKDGED